MPTRDEIRELIAGAAEGATGCIEALAAAGAAALVEDFDVEVGLSPNGEGSALSATVRFAVVVAAGEASALPRVAENVELLQS